MKKTFLSAIKREKYEFMDEMMEYARIEYLYNNGNENKRKKKKEDR